MVVPRPTYRARRPRACRWLGHMDLQHAGTLASFLDNYWARSQVFRTVQFSSAMLSGFIAKPCPECGQKLMTVSNAISNMRVMLRLLDDLPVLVEVIKSWSNPKVTRV